MASSGMHTEPTHHLPPDTEAALPDSVPHLQKASHPAPAVRVVPDAAVPADSPNDGWYEP